ncbi:MAG: hypothetical protein K2P35_13625 [Lachnospiraceae bacterium]|nr:hypothetical protein [Lachnospiraceae bacterium]
MDSVLTEKWFELSLVQQMINIGNEVKRALKCSSDPDKKNMFFHKAIQYTQLTMEDPQNAHVLPELSISKVVLEDYCGEHKLACTGEQISRYYQAYQYLLPRSCKGELK